MSDRTRVNIIGRLVKAPEIRTNNNGKQYATFSVATGYYDTTNRQQATMYLSCMASERYVKYLQIAEAGDKVDVIGRLAPNAYTDKQGTKHEGYSIMVEDIDVTKKSTGTAQAPAAGQQKPQQAAGQQHYQQTRYQSQQALAPQQSNRYEQSPFDNQGQNNGFRPATYNY